MASSRLKADWSVADLWQKICWRSARVCGAKPVWKSVRRFQNWRMSNIRWGSALAKRCAVSAAPVRIACQSARPDFLNVLLQFLEFNFWRSLCYSQLQISVHARIWIFKASWLSELGSLFVFNFCFFCCFFFPCQFSYFSRDLWSRNSSPRARKKRVWWHGWSWWLGWLSDSSGVQDQTGLDVNLDFVNFR